MARQIDYRSSSRFAADDVAAVMLDEEYLRARLERLGGPGARLLEHHTDAGGGSYRIRHGIDQAVLPPIVTSLVSGNLVIERAESLRRESAGRHAGDVDVRIPGTPVTAVGTLLLHEPGEGSELVVRAEVAVPVPFLGGKLERIIAEQVQNLLAAETAFTLDWLARTHR